ncbi:MAG: anti-sigma factor [Planctomycetota bacterium]
MRCEDARPAIQSRLDGELDLVACELLESHLGVCEACRRVQAQLRELRELLQEVGRSERPRDAGAPLVEVTRPYRWPWWAVPAAAAALIGVALLPWPAAETDRGGPTDIGSLERNRTSDATQAVDVSDPPVGREAQVAGFEIDLGAASSEWLAVHERNTPPGLHVVWLYNTQKGDRR